MQTTARTAATALLVAATVVVAAASSHAQSRPASPTPSTPAVAAAAVQAALDDPTIVAIFDAANTWDMETGALGARKGHSKDVRAFGRMMVRDHRMVRQQGRDLAAKLHVTPTPPGKDFALYQDHVAIMKTLRAAHGAAFDKAFIDHEVTYHQAVIDAVTTQLLPATQNADLKALEVKVAPAFQAHLAAAKEVQGKVEAKVAAK
jgi:putative membrane protein